MKNVKFAAYIVALVAVVGLSVGFVTHAFSGSSSGVVIENVQTLNLNLPAGQSVGSADVTSDVSGDVVGDASGDVVLGAAAVSTGDLVVNPQNFKNGFLVNGSRVITAGRVLTANTSTVARFVQGGTATALTAVATSTLTAAQICNSSFISVTPVSTTPTIT